MSHHIHQEVEFAAAPARVYDALIDERQFSTLSGGAPTQISNEAGGAFSCFGGMIVGRQVELTPKRRIVQAWRAGNWDDGLYSIARFELREQGVRNLACLRPQRVPRGPGRTFGCGLEGQLLGAAEEIPGLTRLTLSTPADPLAAEQAVTVCPGFRCDSGWVLPMRSWRRYRATSTESHLMR